MEVEGCYVSPTTLEILVGSIERIRDGIIERLPERAQEQFPWGRTNGVFVKTVPEGELPVYAFMVHLVCYEPVSDPKSSTSSLIVCWLSDDIETNLPEMIDREICSVEWDKYAEDEAPALASTVPAPALAKQSVHPLDSWFYRKPRIQQAGIEAILIDEPWEQFLAKRGQWTTDDIVRVRCLLRPQPEDIEQFLASAVFIDEPLSSSSLDAWRRPKEECLAGCGLGVSTWPNDIFHFSCKFEPAAHGDSRLWGCTARQFTSEWALFSVHGYERLPEGVIPQGFNQYPLGFIKNSHYLKSAALLLSKALNHGDHLLCPSFWEATSIVGNIAPEEVYRMLLASSGLGTSRVLLMSAEKLKKHRPRGIKYRYETVENMYQLDEDYEFCPICNHVNNPRSGEICQHFVGEYGEGEIDDYYGEFTAFKREWESLLAWCEENVDELGEPKLERLVSKTCMKLRLPRKVAKLLTDDPRDPQSDATCAFQELFDLKHGKDMTIYCNLYSKTPGQIEKLTKSLGRMSQLLQGGKPDAH